MLKQTFCHIPGIGYATEQQLWAQGVTTWEDLVRRCDLVTRVSDYDILDALERSLAALVDDPSFFVNSLKRSDGWRLFPHFRDKTAYLDIETTGLGHDFDITTIALYDGRKVRTYINGQNLQDFLEDIVQYRVIITYNGISFDIPVIERYFRTRLTQTQIDLRYVLAQLGYKGGLKGCEKQMGINRGMLEGVDGYFAVLLWREYERYNNEAALETLLAYNIEDTVNLERLMVEAYNRNVAGTPFASELFLPLPESPQLIHQPDPEIMSRMSPRYSGSS
jgi:uncharacterized protein YprB with RNaseH-like and TPR domain